MKNEDTELVINGYNNQLLFWDAKKKVLEQMIADLNKQYHNAFDEWNGVWLEKQTYLNNLNEKTLDDPMDDYNYVGSKDHY
jgi:hypothetical protein